MIVIATVLSRLWSTSIVSTSGYDHDSYGLLRSNADKEPDDDGDQVYVDIDANAAKDLDDCVELRSYTGKELDDDGVRCGLTSED